MRKVTLFIAMSLDGYIADSKGKVDWLEGQDENVESPDIYGEFVKDIDTVIMGRNTYDQIVTELLPNDWVYHGMTTYVVTHHREESSEEVYFTDQNPTDLVRKLKEEDGKGIWICGGAEVVRRLVEENLIDCYYLTVIPVLLGSGIRLFGNNSNEMKLRLVKSQSYNGMTDLVYVKR